MKVRIPNLPDFYVSATTYKQSLVKMLEQQGFEVEQSKLIKCSICNDTGYFQIQLTQNTSPCPCTFYIPEDKR